MNTPANIELVCLPLIPNVQAMSIEINRDATIYHLKEKIKAAYTSNLNGVGEADLLLYALKDQDADQITASQILANPAPHLQNLLSTLQTVAECFPTIPVQKFHVLIRIPGPLPGLRQPILQVIPQLNGYPDRTSDETVDKLLHAFLKQLRPMIRSYLTAPPRYWAPASDDATTQRFYLDLAIPRVRDEPSLLIHGLGNTRNPYADKLSRGPSHQILCNTSGSGKTRILFDLLCQHWGFYFVMAHGPDRIGATDFETVIDEMGSWPGWIPDIFKNSDPETVLKAMKVNEGIASRLISKILLARWIIFRAFIETYKELNNGALDEHAKLKWLLFQVLPIQYDNYWDPFIALIDRCLVGVTDQHFLSLKAELVPNTVLGTAFDIETDKFLFVLDEAQLAGKQHTRAFSDRGGTLKRPVLSPIIRQLVRRPSPNNKFIVSGTGFSLEQFRTVLASGVGKPDLWEIVHQTGDFTDEIPQFTYFSRYFPPSFLLSPSGEALKTRLYEFLRGRYGFTAGFIEELLKGPWSGNQPAAPQGLFNAYVSAYTDYTPVDGDKALLEQEPAISTSRIGRFEWEKIEAEEGLLEDLSDSIFNYITQGKYPLWHNEKKTLVEYGIAQFTEVEDVRVQEPLPLISIIRYFGSHRRTLDHTLHKQFQDNQGVGFEETVLLAISKLLRNGKPLSEIFEFHPSTPGWAHFTAKIVTRTSSGDFVQFDLPDGESIAPSTGVAFHAETLDEVKNWLESGDTGWCIPGNLMGPDLMTWLRLSDGKLLLLVIQAKCYFSGNVDTLKAEDTAKALRSLIPDNFFAATKQKNAKETTLIQKQDKIDAMLAVINKPEELFTSGKYNVLRVVAAFPLGTNLDSKSADIKLALEEDNHPLAVLTPSALSSALVTTRRGPSIISMLNNALKRTRAMVDDNGETGQPSHKTRRVSSK